jgi:hypothetical protein
MSTPVITSKWAGNFDCTVCRRKRLMADEFSKSSLDKHRKTGQTLQCKPCVAKQEQEKRMEAARNKNNKNINNNDNDDDNNNEKRTCAGLCNQLLSMDSYNRTIVINGLSRKVKVDVGHVLKNLSRKMKISNKIIRMEKLMMLVKS